MANYLVLVTILAVPALATAEPHPKLLEKTQPAPIEQPDWGAHSRLTGTMGLFTPVGEVGIEYTQMIAPFFELGVGAGLGLSGPQVAIMPRMRAGEGAVSMSFGAGFSGGAYHDLYLGLCIVGDSCRDTTVKTTVLWANAEAGIQWTSREGVAVRLYGGGGRVLTHGTCHNGDCDGVNGTMLPYGGLALGHTF